MYHLRFDFFTTFHPFFAQREANNANWNPFIDTIRKNSSFLHICFIWREKRNRLPFHQKSRFSALAGCRKSFAIAKSCRCEGSFGIEKYSISWRLQHKMKVVFMIINLEHNRRLFYGLSNFFVNKAINNLHLSRGNPLPTGRKKWPATTAASASANRCFWIRKQIIIPKDRRFRFWERNVAAAEKGWKRRVLRDLIVKHIMKAINKEFILIFFDLIKYV